MIYSNTNSRKLGKKALKYAIETLTSIRKQIYEYEWKEIHDINEKVQKINLY